MDIEKLDINNSDATISITPAGQNRYVGKITLYMYLTTGKVRVRHSTIYGTTDRVQKIDRKITFKSDGVYVRFQWDKLRQVRSLTVHEIPK